MIDLLIQLFAAFGILVALLVVLFFRDYDHLANSVTARATSLRFDTGEWVRRRVRGSR